MAYPGEEGHRVAADVLSADHHDEAKLRLSRRGRVPNGNCRVLVFDDI